MGGGAFEQQTMVRKMRGVRRSGYFCPHFSDARRIGFSRRAGGVTELHRARLGAGLRGLVCGGTRCALCRAVPFRGCGGGGVSQKNGGRKIVGVERGKGGGRGRRGFLGARRGGRWTMRSRVQVAGKRVLAVGACALLKLLSGPAVFCVCSNGSPHWDGGARRGGGVAAGSASVGRWRRR